jgi:hypothetical protein
MGYILGDGFFYDESSAPEEYAGGTAYSGELVDTITHRNTLYFLFDSPAVIKRYNLEQQEFLDDLRWPSLGDATAIHVDDDGLSIKAQHDVFRGEVTMNDVQ